MTEDTTQAAAPPVPPIGGTGVVAAASPLTVAPPRVADAAPTTGSPDVPERTIAYSSAADQARADAGELPTSSPPPPEYKYATGMWAGLPHFTCPFCSRFAKVNSSDEEVADHIAKTHPQEAENG